MQALLTELTNFVSSAYELKVKDIAKHGHVICYVRFPITSSDQSFQKTKNGLMLPSEYPDPNTRHI